jgi:uncharacterized membrane protein
MTGTMTTTVSPDMADTSRPGPSDGPSGDAVAASRSFAWLLIVTGAAGLLAAWVITIDKFKLLEARVAGETYTPGCSLNPIVSCGNIMESDQASAFGFPNPMLGLVSYAVVIAIGVSALSGARHRRWFWLGLQGGTLFGVGFCTWLMYQSLYVINALCLWCSLAWVATILMFWYTLVHNLRLGIIPAPDGLKRGVLEFHWALPVVHVGIIGMLILTRWWDFWTG